MVKELRERTGVGMAKCKEALDQVGGDMEKAIDFLRKAGAASAVKKEGRETNEGTIGVLEDATGIALVEVNAETDFVIQNEKFKNFVNELAAQALQEKTSSLETFLASKRNGQTIDEIRIELVQSMGENLKVRRVHFMKKQAGASYGLYSHMGGKIVTAVELSGVATAGTVAREVAMHAAAEAPEYLSPDEVPQELKAREEEIAREQVKGRPENIMSKIVEGKMNAFYDQVCLPRQKFVKDPSLTVAQFIEKSAKGATLTAFIRWQMGV
ncbi:MAG: elongation factor Ts [Simkaniaceae bacterium]|nr:elongation factor Ts [Simkaniaceae bacterium]